MLGVLIEDTGGGFEVAPTLAARASSGLSGMQERAALLGGSLTIESTPGAGTQITLELPLSGAAKKMAHGYDDPTG
jgi:signal transduction histidine kinase